eukprot:XP_019923470.1 PREDICTED: SWI/SNF-related matrix-associated actin-dependent regulator of chromatin subfamily A-like protein 1 isoform X2 [Crassostrea gigas]
MSALTEEQKRRIEENKRKALAKRAQKLSPVKSSGDIQKQQIEENRLKALALRAEKPSKVSEPSQAHYSKPQTDSRSLINQINKTSNAVVTGKNTFSNNGPGNSSFKTSTTGDTHNNKRNGVSSGSSYKTQTLNKPAPQQSVNGAESNVAKIAESIATSGPSQSTLGGGTTAKCLLISRERFEVTSGYFPPLVDLFKTMATKKYDAVTKKWSFKLEEYQKLVSAMRAMSPQVRLVPLPQAVLSTFQQQLKGVYPDKEIPTADLSHLDASLVNSLLPFQRVGVNFGVHKNGRILLADDMGLGKTIQAICLACYYRNEWPLLIVVPSSVRFDWAQQLQRWVPSLDPQEVYVALSGKCSLSGHKVCILSYDLMAKKSKDLLERNFNVVIMDECHLLKNFKTARCKAAMPILKAAKRVILLSGTPALSRPQELYTQICAVKPYMFQYQDFGVRYCDESLGMGFFGIIQHGGASDPSRGEHYDKETEKRGDNSAPRQGPTDGAVRPRADQDH